MNVVIVCPGCGARYPNIDARFLQRRVKCKKCGFKFKAVPSDDPPEGKESSGPTFPNAASLMNRLRESTELDRKTTALERLGERPSGSARSGGIQDWAEDGLSLGGAGALLPPSIASGADPVDLLSHLSRNRFEGGSLDPWSGPQSALPQGVIDLKISGRFSTSSEKIHDSLNPGPGRDSPEAAKGKTDESRPEYRVLTLPSVPKDIKYSPQMVPRLTGFSGGIHLNRKDIEGVGFFQLVLVSAFEDGVGLRGVPSLMLFLENQARPFLVDQSKVQFNLFPGVRGESLKQSFKNLVNYLWARNPELILDLETYRFAREDGHKIPVRDRVTQATRLARALEEGRFDLMAADTPSESSMTSLNLEVREVSKKKLVSLERIGFKEVWNEELRVAMGEAHGVCLTENGEYALVGSGAPQPEISSWRLADGQGFGRIGDLSAPVLGLELSRDENLLMFFDREAVRLWNLSSAKVIHTLGPSRTGMKAARLTPDCRLVVLIEEYSEKILVWDVAEGGWLSPLSGHCAPVEALGLESDGKLLASADRDGGVRLWDLNTLSCLQVLEAGPQSPSALAFGGKGDGLVALGPEGSMTVWHLDAKDPPVQVDLARSIGALDGFFSGLRSLAVTRDGSFAITGALEGGRDCLVRIWEIPKGVCRAARLAHSRGISALVLDREERTLVSLGVDGTLRRFQIQWSDPA